MDGLLEALTGQDTEEGRFSEFARTRPMFPPTRSAMAKTAVAHRGLPSVKTDLSSQFSRIEATATSRIFAQTNPSKLLGKFGIGRSEIVLNCGSARIGGVLSGAAHVVERYIRTMIDTFLAGTIDEAAGMQRKLYPLLKIMGQNGRINPVCLWKEALKLWGVDAGIPRRPLTPGTPEEIAEVRQAIVTFGVL